MPVQPKLLIVSYVFPPAGGITVQRALSLAKYLPACGVEVHVLTAANAASPVYDPGLLKHIPPEVTVHRAFTPELPFYLRKKLWNLFSGGKKGTSKPAGAAPKTAPAPPSLKSRATAWVRRIFSPDPQVVWAPFAVRRAARLIRRHKIDWVLVTAPPFSVFLIGNALKRKFPGIRLISDFRDEWLRFYVAEFDFLRNDHTRLRAEAIERATIESSDLVLAVTRSSLQEIAGRYPEQPGAKFGLIANGYDPETFASFTSRPHNGGGMVVTHAGTVYKSSSPHYYFDALDALPEELRRDVRTRFIGRVTETEENLLRERGGEAVEVLGFMPQREALRRMEETDFLLLTMTNDYSLPGKLFEYMATGKPILAISPRDGEVDRILRETGAGWCADPERPDEIVDMLRRACEFTRTGRNGLSPDRDAIRRYERPRLAAELADLLRRSFR